MHHLSGIEIMQIIGLCICWGGIIYALSGKIRMSL
jgi:hypothetical protein